MRKLQTREEILASRLGAMNEMVFKMGDIYQVKFVADVPKSLVNAFVSKAKKEYDKDPREIWSDMDLAELFVKYVTTTYLNVDSLPVECALGEKNTDETGSAQGTVTNGVQTQPAQQQPAQSTVQTQLQPAQLQDETKIADIPAALQVEGKKSVRKPSKKKILENYLNTGRFTVSGNGNLVITLEGTSEEDKAEMQEFQGADEDFLWKFFESELTNGFNLVPDNFKGLTEAPMISDEVIDDATDMIKANIWFFNDYQLRSVAEDLLTKGSVEFIKAEGNSQVTENNSSDDLLKAQFTQLAKGYNKDLADADMDELVDGAKNFAKAQNKTELDSEDIRSILKSHFPDLNDEAQ